MGEYEPNDSRKVTLTNNTAPGEPPRTGPREGETRRDEGERGTRAAPRAASNQSQGSGTMSQSMGGMSQSMAGAPHPSPSTPSSDRAQQVATEGLSPQAPDQHATREQNLAPGTSYGSNPIEQPQQMHEGDTDAERTRRQQAAGQGGTDAPTRPDAEGEIEADEEDRGYGGGGQERIDRIEKDR